MKKVMKIIGIIILILIVVAAVAFGLYWHHNIQWTDGHMGRLCTCYARTE